MPPERCINSNAASVEKETEDSSSSSNAAESSGSTMSSSSLAPLDVAATFERSANAISPVRLESRDLPGTRATDTVEDKFENERGNGIDQM